MTVSEGSDSDYDSVEIVVSSVIANAGSDVVIEEGESVTLTASGGDSYLWNSGSTSQSITVSPDSTTNYSVTVIKNGCEDLDSLEVRVIPISGNLKVDVGEDQVICLGESVVLTANGGSSYLWDNGATTKSITVSPRITTIYTVTASDGSNSDIDSVEVLVNSILANAGPDVAIDLGESITLTATGGDSYMWSTGSTTQSITVSPDATTTYTVEVYKNGCIEGDSVQISVNQNGINIPSENVDLGNERSKLDYFSVYPNPSSNGSVNVKANADYNFLKLSILSTNGSMVYFDKIQTINNVAEKEIDISNLTKGVYILNLYNSDYHKTKKIVVL